MKVELFSLITSIIVLFFIINFIKTKKKSQLVTVWYLAIILMVIWCLGLVLQITLSDRLNINPIYFDYIVYISACFLPIVVFLIGKIYSNTNIKFKKYHLFFLIIPILTLIVLWTNDFHHLFYKEYSIYLDDTVVGPYSYVHYIYEYAFIFLGIFNLLKATIKNSGFFSKQSLLIILGVAIPVVANILGTFKIIPMTIYITPICFSITLFLLAIAMLRFNLLDATPIALQKIVDRISDSYLVLNENNIIIDFNKTFLSTFELKSSDVRNIDILDFIKNNEYKINIKKFTNALKKAKNSSKTQKLNETFGKIEKTFTIEISDLVSQGNYLGCIILFKDITQHIHDMETIKNNQEMLIERERLASLGQMIGRNFT